MSIKVLVVSLFCSFIVFAVAIVLNYFNNSEKKKLMKIYDSIQIGDEYIMNKREADPFFPNYEGKVVIKEKKVNKDGVPYVMFKGENNISFYSCSLWEFLEVRHYEPYTGQDK